MCRLWLLTPLHNVCPEVGHVWTFESALYVHNAALLLAVSFFHYHSRHNLFVSWKVRAPLDFWGVFRQINTMVAPCLQITISVVPQLPVDIICNIADVLYMTCQRHVVSQSKEHCASDWRYVPLIWQQNCEWRLRQICQVQMRLLRLPAWPVFFSSMCAYTWSKIRKHASSPLYAWRNQSQLCIRCVQKCCTYVRRVVWHDTYDSTA